MKPRTIIYSIKWFKFCACFESHPFKITKHSERSDVRPCVEEKCDFYVFRLFDFIIKTALWFHKLLLKVKSKKQKLSNKAQRMLWFVRGQWIRLMYDIVDQIVEIIAMLRLARSLDRCVCVSPWTVCIEWIQFVCGPARFCVWVTCIFIKLSLSHERFGECFAEY